MTDSFGNLLKIGDSIIVTVSKGSVYLTLAEILDYDFESGKTLVSYLSTPKEKWIDLNREASLLYPEPMRELYSETKLFKDNAGIKVVPGDTVAWKNEEIIGIDKIYSVESELWATLENGIKVRNTQIIKLDI